MHAVITAVGCLVIAVAGCGKTARLKARLESTTIASDKAELLKRLIDIGSEEAKRGVEEYAASDPLVAYEVEHSIAMLHDPEAARTYEIVRGNPVVSETISTEPSGDPLVFEAIEVGLSSPGLVEFRLKWKNESRCTIFGFKFERDRVVAQGLSREETCD